MMRPEAADAALKSIQQRLKTAGLYLGPVDGLWGKGSDGAFDGLLALARPQASAPPSHHPATATDADFAQAAGFLGCTVSQVRAVWEVESGGGFFTDVRADILALDGPGGFLDGDLPKILFEAHVFDRLTGGKFRAAYPNLSSPSWNRKLYVGGQGEYARLYRAMTLDHDAALKSASWGGAQIMGFNYDKAGYMDVESFVEAMKRGEKEHLLAFAAFVKNSHLDDELRQVSGDPRTCAPFAAGYNGQGFAANRYDAKIADAFLKWSR